MACRAGAAFAPTRAAAVALRDGEERVVVAVAKRRRPDARAGAPTARAARRRSGKSTERALLRRAAGRVFVLAGDTLVEQGLPAEWVKQAIAVEAFSPDYFELLRTNPSLREVLALGDRIAFRDGERIVHVSPPPPPASKPAAPPISTR